MRIQAINFPEQQAMCVFSDVPANLASGISALGLKEGYPVIVLIGGSIDEQHSGLTRRAIQTLAKAAEETKALVICGGTNMDVMAEIGRGRSLGHYKFPLVGIAPEALVTWPDGPRSTNFMFLGKKRLMLAPYYSHFILVPGLAFGDEATWVIEAAAILSEGYPSVTVLINGGDASRKDVQLSVENGRPVIALGGTWRLANELAGMTGRNTLITVVPANTADRIDEAVRAAFSGNKITLPARHYSG